MTRTLRLATWNINSVRLRIEQICTFLEQHQPDILCLQETKCPNDQFPIKALVNAGYQHIAHNGQSGYHGVATISKLPFASTDNHSFCDKGDARHVRVRLEGSPGISIHNLYIPAGGDEPDPVINEKFAHKLQFLDELETFLLEQAPAHAQDISLLAGDFNIAPHENDVWSHKQLLKVVSHTPIEVDRLNQLKNAGGWADIMRDHTGDDEKLFTWWSYRSRDWQVNNRGRRLDHIWIDDRHRDKIRNFEIIADTRSWTKPSDHVPVIANLQL